MSLRLMRLLRMTSETDVVKVNVCVVVKEILNELAADDEELMLRYKNNLDEHAYYSVYRRGCTWVGGWMDVQTMIDPPPTTGDVPFVMPCLLAKKVAHEHDDSTGTWNELPQTMRWPSASAFVRDAMTRVDFNGWMLEGVSFCKNNEVAPGGERWTAPPDASVPPVCSGTEIERDVRPMANVHGWKVVIDYVDADEQEVQRVSIVSDKSVTYNGDVTRVPKAILFDLTRLDC